MFILGGVGTMWVTQKAQTQMCQWIIMSWEVHGHTMNPFSLVVGAPGHLAVTALCAETLGRIENISV